MRGLALAIILLLAAIAGCSQSGDIMLECKSPLIQKGDGCCMDADLNGVCDIDERPAIKAEKKAKPNETEQSEPNTITEQKKEAEPPKPEEPAAENLNIIDEAEKTAKLFAEKWQAKQYNLMYAMFTPELKAKKTATEFTTIMELDPFYKKLNKIEVTGVKPMDDDSAELGIKAYTTIQQIDIPGAKLEFIDGSWKVSAFVDVFDLPTFDAACSGYRNDNHYTVSDCAFDFAKKMKDASYCNASACHYKACLDFLGKPAGMKQEAEQCYLCQPVGKTVNDCILDVALKYDKIAACDVIKEDRYSDKYCTCYGGYAKAKNNAGYCNMIQDADNKYLCEKSFKGEYC